MLHHFNKHQQICARNRTLSTNTRTPRFREPMIMIGERPASVEDRAVPGHREGDPVRGAGNRSAIGTLVERATRFTIPLHLPDRHDARSVRHAIIAKMRHLPKILRNTLTRDQGGELALHTRIGTVLGMRVYFSRPAQPVAAGHQREHQRTAAPIPPQGHRPEHLPRGLP